MPVIRRIRHGYTPTTPPKRSKVFAPPTLMRDLSEIYREGGIESPIDGEFITSRSQLRAHEQKHGVKQCGELSAEDQTRLLKESYERTRAEIAAAEGVDFKWE
jgi:hypothetical protein